MVCSRQECDSLAGVLSVPLEDVVCDAEVSVATVVSIWWMLVAYLLEMHETNTMQHCTTPCFDRLA